MKWLKYNISQKTYSPTSFEDVLIDKKDIVHNEAFETAKRLAIINSKDSNGNPLFLEKYDEDVDILSSDDVIYVDQHFHECERENAVWYVLLNNWKFIEINNEYDTYVSAPYLLCTRRNIQKNLTNSRFIRHKIWLGAWWNMAYEIILNTKVKNITEDLIDEYPYNEIIGYDYIRKKALLENRVENNKRKIPFSHIKRSDIINIDYKNIY